MNLKKISVKTNAFLTMLLAMLFMQPCRANPVTRFAKKFARDNKGFSAVLVSIIIVVVAAILIIVAAIVISKVGSSINRSGLSAEANDTLDSTLSQAYGALNLLQVVLIILAAVSIIGAVVGIFAYIKMRG